MPHAAAHSQTVPPLLSLCLAALAAAPESLTDLEGVPDELVVQLFTVCIAMWRHGQYLLIPSCSMCTPACTCTPTACRSSAPFATRALQLVLSRGSLTPRLLGVFKAAGGTVEALINARAIVDNTPPIVPDSPNPWLGWHRRL
jgi:hypothetical protein